MAGLLAGLSPGGKVKSTFDGESQKRLPRF
jgi:hypothetical protein